MTNYKNMIINNASKFLLGAALCALLGGSATSIKAESNNLPSINHNFSVGPELNVQQDSDYVYEYYYYNFKRNAESSHRMNKNMGNSEMYYDSSRRKWVVKIRKERGSTSSTNNSTSARTSNIRDTSVNSSNYALYPFYTKRNAEMYLRNRRQAGRDATMYYDAPSKKWIVSVRVNRGSLNSDSVTRTTPRVTNDVQVDGGKLPNGAQITYSPTKELAEALYKSALKQGIWTKMWYDSARQSWAVAMK